MKAIYFLPALCLFLGVFGCQGTKPKTIPSGQVKTPAHQDWVAEEGASSLDQLFPFIGVGTGGSVLGFIIAKLFPGSSTDTNPHTNTNTSTNTATIGDILKKRNQLNRLDNEIKQGAMLDEYAKKAASDLTDEDKKAFQQALTGWGLFWSENPEAIGKLASDFGFESDYEKAKKELGEVTLELEQLKPVGIPNCGNSCYANSAFQVMFVYQPLLNRVLELVKDSKKINELVLDYNKHATEKEKTAYKNIMRTVIRLFVERYAENPNQQFMEACVERITGEAVGVNLIGKKGDSARSQQDATELLNPILHMFDLQPVVQKIHSTYFKDANDDGKKQNRDDDRSSFSKSENYTYLTLPIYFNGEVLKVYDKEPSKDEFEKSKEFEKAFKKAGEAIVLNDVLKHYVDEKSSDSGEQYNTDKGWRSAKYHKKIEIEPLDNIFVSFNRYANFKYRFQEGTKLKHSSLTLKLKTPIRFSTQEDLGPLFGLEESLYTPVAFAVQDGGLGGGHYYAYVKYPDGWYELNDKAHTKVEGEIPKAAQSAYLVLYKKIKASE